MPARPPKHNHTPATSPLKNTDIAMEDFSAICVQMTAKRGDSRQKKQKNMGVYPFSM